MIRPSNSIQESHKNQRKREKRGRRGFSLSNGVENVHNNGEDSQGEREREREKPTIYEEEQTATQRKN